MPRMFVAALVSLCLLPTAVTAGTSNGLLDVSADGKLLACSNRDNGSVSVVDLATNQTVREIPVGSKPEGLSFVGPTHVVAVAVYGEDRVAFLNADDGKSLGQTEVFDEPYGVVSSPDGSRVFVTLEYPGEVVEIDPKTRQATRSLPVGKFPRGIALDAKTNRLYVTEYLTANVRVIDLESGTLVDEIPGASTDNLARQVVLHPTRPKAYVPHIRYQWLPLDATKTRDYLRQCVDDVLTKIGDTSHYHPGIPNYALR